jgi:hypothetical protein
MNMIIQKDISIRDMISIAELLIRFICMKKIIISRGIQIAMQELNKNLHLMVACLRRPLKVNHILESVKFMLFITASRAEKSLNTM